MLIGELSRRTGVSPRLLRYYGAQELLVADRGPNGYREYREETVVVVRQIRALLDAGLPTEVIRTILPCAEGELPRIDLCEGLRGVLEQQLTELDARIDGLQRRRGALAGYLT